MDKQTEAERTARVAEFEAEREAQIAAAQRRRRAQRRRDAWWNVALWSGTVVVVALIVYLAWVLPSSLEARAFNRATGKNVTTWEAMWVDLRVQGEAK
jgi:hypothetical protein